MFGLRIFALTLLMLFAAAVECRESTRPHLDTVEQFIAAFNAHESSAMGLLVTDDIEWLSIAGSEVVIETSGRAELIAEMDAYFKSCLSCKSQLTSAVSTAGRVSAVEVASWQTEGGRKSQRSLSVYEFAGDMISRVYYFPAEQ